MEYEECKGCSVVDDCGFLFFNTEETCPCFNCLIKPMCRKACEEWIKRRSKGRREIEYGNPM